MRETFTKELKDSGAVECQTYSEKGGVKIGTPAFSSHIMHQHTDTITEVWFVDTTHPAVTGLPRRIQHAQLQTRLVGQFDIYKHDNKQEVLFTAPDGQYFVYVGTGDDAFVAFVKSA